MRLRLELSFHFLVGEHVVVEARSEYGNPVSSRFSYGDKEPGKYVLEFGDVSPENIDFVKRRLESQL